MMKYFHDWKNIPLLLLTVLTLIASRHHHAQFQGADLIYDGLPVTNLTWSSDSDKVAFQIVAGGLETEQVWFSYDVTSKSPLQTSDWPFQVTSGISGLSGINTDLPTFLSPDNRFLVTATHGIENSTVIVELDTGKVFDTGVRARTIQIPVRRFDVDWSDDSNSFVLSTSARMGTETEFYYHIRGYALPSASIVKRELSGFSVEWQDYATTHIYDLSPVNGSVLLHSHYYLTVPTTTGPFYQLGIWHPANDQVSLIQRFNEHYGEKGILDAVFLNEDSILLVNEEGLIQFNIETSEELIIRPDINSLTFRTAKFSPDGRYIVAIVSDTTESAYLIDLSPFLLTDE